MADGDYDNPSFDLFAAFQARFNLSDSAPAAISPDTRVLASAEHIAHNAVDVFIPMDGTRTAAACIAALMKSRGYDPQRASKAWHAHPLHPSVEVLGPERCMAFIFVMDLLNFSFWSERDEEERFGIEYRGQKWTGYSSLLAGMQRALDEGVDILSPDLWTCEESLTIDDMRHIFRSATDEEMPLLEERLGLLREAGRVLYEQYDCSVVDLIESAEGSAGRLVNILARDFDGFRDETEWEEKEVRFLKRAQILVADLWACFAGQPPVDLTGVESLTAFADYRIPQMLSALGVLEFAPPVEARIRRQQDIPSHSDWEIQIRGCSIWAVELIRREMLHDDPKTEVYPLLIDYFLYDYSKEQEAKGAEVIPHHRTRSIWY